MITAGPNIVVIGIGNEYRSDDGVGIAVARRLHERFLTKITVLEESGEGAALMDSWKGATWVMMLDAVHSGAPPGTIHRLDARAAPVPTEFFHYSTHAFSVAEAIELARSLDELPPHLIVYGVEGENFSAGEGLSPTVERAVETVVERAADEVRGAMKEDC
jgi:hydrogenase maturation protease